MRAEILNRSTTQAAIAGLHVTAVATIVGVIINQDQYRDLGLLIPFISPLLGLLYLDHHATIARLSRRIEAYYTAVSLPTYQGESIMVRRSLPYLCLYLLPTVLLYALAPGIALVWLSMDVFTRWELIAWRAGIAWVAFYVAIAIAVLGSKPTAPDIIPEKLWSMLPPLPERHDPSGPTQP